MIEYKNVVACTGTITPRPLLQNLKTVVENSISNGWEPIGGVVLFTRAKNEELFAIQTMKKVT